MGCCGGNKSDEYYHRSVNFPVDIICEIELSDPQVANFDSERLPPRTNWQKHSTNKFWSDIPVPIKVQLVHPKAKAPVKAHNGDIAWDIFCVDDDMWNSKLFCEGEPCFELMPYESYTFSTGIKVGVPHNYGFLLRERSGLGVSDISLGAGVIEGTYRGEWRIHIRNISKKPRMFKVGDKICQAVLIPIIPAQTELVNELPSTERGEKGFGSSGR